MSALACLGGIYAANPCVRVQIVAVFVWVFLNRVIMLHFRGAFQIPTPTAPTRCGHGTRYAPTAHPPHALTGNGRPGSMCTHKFTISGVFLMSASASDTKVSAAPVKNTTPRSRVILASLVGTTIEFYDFYIYATAAVAVFPVLFFPSKDATTELLASFATFGVAFIARPLGSVIFGHFGDKIGRKATLVGALLTMGLATFIIGLLPTYHQIGLWAPTMLTIMRFCQGLGLGGEWSGAALLASEYAEDGKRARAAMWP